MSTFNTSSKYGEIEYWLFIEEHTNTRRKKLQTAPLRKDQDFIKKMRWIAIFFRNNNKKAPEDYKAGFSYGLKSGKRKQVKDLIQFEDDLVRIVKELKFHKVNNNFQTKLGEDMKHVQTSKKKNLLRHTKHPKCTDCIRGNIKTF